MSVAQPTIQERRPAPGAALNLSSNNPFRRKPPPPPVTSTPANAPTNPPQNEQPNPNNPFLDNYKPQIAPAAGLDQQPTSPPRRVMGPPSGRPVRQPATNGADTADLLNGLVLSEKPESERNILPRPPQSRNGPVPRQGHRVARSDEEQPHPPQMQNGSLKPRIEVSRSPRRRENQRPRRNSESSVMDVKDQERKDEDGSKKPNGPTGDDKSRHRRPHRPRKPHHPIDLIDKLDATGIYGPAMFHHDGPFDACNPHRNRKGSKAAPMQAFAEGSLNNTLGGAGPLRSNTDIDRLHGRVAEGFTDYNQTSALRPLHRPAPRDYQMPVADIINPYSQTQIHGDESFGLGTSTFLEGTPVSRAALHRQISESDANASTTGPQLQRKKSLANKIRGFSRPRGDSNDGRMFTPDARYTEGPSSPSDPRTVQSAGGRVKMQEVNPFFENITHEQLQSTVPTHPTEQDEETAIKDTSETTELEIVGQARTTEQPRPQTARPQTGRQSNEYETDGKSGVGGLLTRVKSLRGGKRTRPERTSG